MVSTVAWGIHSVVIKTRLALLVVSWLCRFVVWLCLGCYGLMFCFLGSSIMVVPFSCLFEARWYIRYRLVAFHV